MGRIIDAIARRLLMEWLETGTVAIEQLEAWEAGDEPVPFDIAHDALARYGIPLEWWPHVAPQLALPSHRHGNRGSHMSRRMSTTATSHPEAHKKRVQAITRRARARVGSKHPFVLWLGDKSIAQWVAEPHKIPAGEQLNRDRVASYLRDAQRRSPPEWFRAMVAAESRGKVPATVWDKAW